ncbi:flagellar hook-associated protein 2 [Cytobacillus massiliigabonensis]|uniref:flagellar hook-associated protein 2 n=1 Tax=Cytobacillus massiliigabonensis TaxID=1871011 RepID=UPI000C814A6B|nr:flagellar hook-associated protein 2 [Cytobacillus massiliigabonensis]
MVRVSGLASGMDIDDIVSKMMQAQRVPLDKMNQKKQYSEWQRDDYRSLNSAMLEFDKFIFDGIGKESSFAKKTVNVSNPNALSVKGVNATGNFSGTMEVKNLASSSTVIGDTAIDNATNKLSAYGINPGENIIKAINEKGEMQEYKFQVTADDTMDSVINKINSETGVTAFFDEKTQKLSFTSKQTGNISGNIDINNDKGIEFVSGDFLGKVFTNKISTPGLNAEFTYNGVKTERTSNVFTINGAEFTLKEKTTSPITFSSTTDVDAVLDTITQFVNKYNELIEKISDKTTEPKNRNFAPLTAEQKKAMSEDEIKLWEEKAKSGTLRGDSTLKSLLSTMRTSLYTSVSGATGIQNLSELGITTTKNYLEGGKLTIDEKKLKEAISKDPSAIYKLFMAEGKPVDQTKPFDEKTNPIDPKTQGLARRLRSDLDSAMKSITEKAGKTGYVNDKFTIGKSLNDLNKRISAFEVKLTKLENRYYSQFTAMEKAIQRANSQSASLMQYFG